VGKQAGAGLDGGGGAKGEGVEEGVEGGGWFILYCFWLLSLLLFNVTVTVTVAVQCHCRYLMSLSLLSRGEGRRDCPGEEGCCCTACLAEC
jgi:hypothetical protein